MIDKIYEDNPLISTPCDCAEWRRLNKACADLLAERDALQKDAERYRFIRRYMVRVIDVDSSGFVTTRVIDYEKSDDLDAAIDAAMQEAQK